MSPDSPFYFCSSHAQEQLAVCLTCIITSSLHYDNSRVTKNNISSSDLMGQKTAKGQTHLDEIPSSQQLYAELDVAQCDFCSSDAKKSRTDTKAIAAD